MSSAQASTAFAPRSLAGPAADADVMRGYRIVAVDDPDELEAYVAAWDDLAGCAIEPNVFYESWMLLPAIEAFRHQVTLRFILVFADPPGGTPVLCGLFPLESMAFYRERLALRHWRLWNHKHCYLGTPLLRATDAEGCLAAFIRWVRDAGDTPLLDWGLISGDGPFFRTLTQVLQATGRHAFVTDCFSRAVLRRRGGADDYLAEALPGRTRKEYRRLLRRLAEQGPVEFAELACADEAGEWIEAFLEFEARGWKGRRGSALNSTEANRRFFRRIATAAARRGRLGMLSLRVAERPIAMKCNLRMRDCGFAFKIAYDECYARFSPGVLLELENIRRFHDQSAMAWMDSCADPDHFMANRLWLDRRDLVMLVSSSGTLFGELLAATLPPLRWMYRKLRRPQNHHDEPLAGIR